MAELKYLVDINLLQNQLIFPKIHSLGTAPSSPSPVEGQLYFDSSAGDKALHVYNGSAWVRLAGQTAAQTVDTIATGDFIAFSDESETGDINNKLTIDNLFKTAPKLVSTAAIANGDFMLFLDGGATGEMKKEAVADIATLFAGAGMTATDSVLNVIGTTGAITVSADAITLPAALTVVNTITNTGLKFGRDTHNLMDFGTDNVIKFTVGTNQAITFKPSGEIEATKFDGALEGNADTATALAATGNIAATGDVVWNVDFSGPNVTAAAAIGTGVIINSDVNASAAIVQTKINTAVDLGGDITFGSEPDDTVNFTGHVSSSFASTGSFGLVETPYGVNFTGDNHSDQGAKIFYTNASSEDKIIFQVGTRNLLEVHNPYTGTTGEVVVNEDSLDVDFRVESNGNDHMIYSDGNNNRVGIGKNNPTQVLDVNGNALATSFIAGSTVISDDSIVMTPSTGDTFTIASGVNGSTTLTTVDTAAAAANLTITVDGQFRVSSTGIDIAANGTISSAVWNGTKIADAYLSDNTAHLDTTQTFTGAKTFTGVLALTGTGQITGVDTVSNSTDAVNKAYVDALDLDDVSVPNLKTALVAGFGSNAVTIGDANDVVTIGNDLTVTGDLLVSGDTVTVNTANLLVEDPLIGLASGNGANTVDIGIWGKYTATGAKYTGLFRDASDSNMWKLFATTGNSHETPGTTTTINTTSGFTYANLTLATLTGNVTGDLTGTADKVTVTDSSAGTAFPVVFHDESDSLLDDTGAFEFTPESGVLDVPIVRAHTSLVPNADDGATIGSANLNFSDIFLADGAVLNFGDDQDVKLTHVHNTGLLLNSTMAIQFNDASQYIKGSSATELEIGATNQINLESTLIDINGNVEISGTATTTGIHTFTEIPSLPVNSIDTAEIAASAVETAKIDDAAVTTAKINDAAVTTAKINDDAVTLAKMQNITQGSIIVGGGSAAPTHLALGTDGYVLTSDGTDVTWAEATGATYKATLTQNVGGSLTEWELTHNLNTKDVMVQLYDISTNDTVYAQVVRNHVNKITVTFNAAPGNNDIRVLVTKI